MSALDLNNQGLIPNEVVVKKMHRNNAGMARLCDVWFNVRFHRTAVRQMTTRGERP
jgi:hypothetical protein